MVGPSIKLPVAFFAELATATDHQPAYVWNVDDASGLQKAINVSAQGLISNRPLAMKQQLEQLKAACSRGQHPVLT